MPTKSYVTGSVAANATFISEIPAELTCSTILQEMEKSDRCSITVNHFDTNKPSLSRGSKKCCDCGMTIASNFQRVVDPNSGKPRHCYS